MKQLPEHGICHVCGTENPHGIGATWYERDDGVIVAEIVFTQAQQGPPGLSTAALQPPSWTRRWGLLSGARALPSPS
jgi:hypothetical protein